LRNARKTPVKRWRGKLDTVVMQQASTFMGPR